MRNHLWVVLVASMLALGGCSPPRVQAQSLTLERPELARVSLIEVDGKIFKFMVYNLSSEPMVVLRDEVFAETPAGKMRRVPGGAARMYNLGPGEAHDLFVKFDLGPVQPGDPVAVHFAAALQIRGEPIPIEPMRFVVR